jgi:hypothetical protein
MRRAIWGTLCVAGLAGFLVAIYAVSSIGTCASGGPYVIENECPGGTGGWVALLVCSPLVVLVAGVGFGPVGAGEPTWWRREGGLIAPLAFVPFTVECAILFGLAAAATLLSAFAPWSDASDSAQGWSVFLAGVWLVLGPGAWLAGRLISRWAEARPSR